MEVESRVTSLRVATLAIVGTIEANVEGDVAAKSALVIDEFTAMLALLTRHLAEAEFF